MSRLLVGLEARSVQVSGMRDPGGVVGARDRRLAVRGARGWHGAGNKSLFDLIQEQSRGALTSELAVGCRAVAVESRGLAGVRGLGSSCCSPGTPTGGQGCLGPLLCVSLELTWLNSDWFWSKGGGPTWMRLFVCLEARTVQIGGFWCSGGVVGARAWRRAVRGPRGWHGANRKMLFDQNR